MIKLTFCKSKHQNNVLLFFATSEGYVKADGTYVFQYKDHLGNVRLSYTNNNGVAQVIDENNFYPFGLRQTDNSSISTLNKNQYNGKEYQDELGLNLTAMDFRQYDNTLGRFNVIDPLAEQDYGITPYHFGYNNPVLFGDPSGLKAMAPESIENNMVPGSVLSLLASGMSGKELTDYLFDQMWGFSMLSIHSGGGGGGGISSDGKGESINKEDIGLILAIIKGGYINVLTSENPFLNWSNEDIKTFAENVFPDLYKNSGSPDFVKELIIGDDPNIAGRALKKVYSNSDGTYTVISSCEILIRSNVLNNIVHLASVVGHELNHMEDFVSGNYAKWANENMSIYSANVHSEIKAYGWEKSMGSPFFNGQKYWNYVQIQSLNNWKF